MVFSAVFTANLFNGLNTTAWTAWVFFAVFIGGILLWVYTVRKFDRFHCHSAEENDHRRCTMPYPLVGLLLQSGVITFTCSHRRISGFVFLLRSSCHCFHVISTRHGELALTPMTSIFSAMFEKRIQKWISHTLRKWATPWRP